MAAKYPEKETILYQWILEKRNSGLCVSGGMIGREAFNIFGGSNTTFGASNGWLCRFLKRHNLVARRISTSGRCLPKNAGAEIEEFLETTDHYFKKNGFDKDTLIGMNETTVYIDAPAKFTYAIRGESRIAATTSGQEKTRVAVSFSALPSGKKLKAMVLIPRKKPLKNQAMEALTTV